MAGADDHHGSHVLSRAIREASVLPCYHPNLHDMNEVKTVMAPYLHHDGHFLLRESISRPGLLTVSTMYGGGIKHFSIQTTEGTYYLQDMHFPTLRDLLQHYQSHDVPNLEQVKGVRIKVAITRASVAGPPLLPGRRFSEVCPPPTPPRRPSLDMSSSAGGASVAFMRARDHAAAMALADHVPRRTMSERKTRVHQGDFVKARCESDSQLRLEGRMRSESESQMKSRPPAPLPVDPVSFSSSSSGDSSTYYSQPQNLEESKIPTLMKQLVVGENMGNMCECGLPVDKSELPRGWSVHICREEPHYNKPFFMGPDSKTAWNLPLEVSLDLNEEQSTLIRELLDEFQKNVVPVSSSSYLATSAARLSGSSTENEGAGASSGATAMDSQSAANFTSRGFDASEEVFQ